MPDFLAQMPYWIAVTLLVVGAMLRGQLMYWIGYGVTHQAIKGARRHPSASERRGPIRRTVAWLDDGGADPGVRALRRWGLVMVPFSYVTVGFQSMVQAGAGILRITWWKYVLAQIPGAIVWGLFYATVGFAAWELALSTAIRSPLGIAAVAALVAVIIVTVRVARRGGSGTGSAERGDRSEHAPAIPEEPSHRTS
ncbi:DedA family protein [Pseudactinotalea sp. HY158]|uniref:DedA family protein n=1 Tax=Pseudactinotalea sp. HY158 TaxID=2654547 RepID=UPI00129D14C5|nr:VTT domain-containing protein [Pseudactinotalea sp. HY158]QGH69539.1 hypothetical protein GCE65_08450 [Pseudactinotalea sp. HY158]